MTGTSIDVYCSLTLPTNNSLLYPCFFLIHSPEDDQSILIETSSCYRQFFLELITTQFENLTCCHLKPSLHFLFLMPDLSSLFLFSRKDHIKYEIDASRRWPHDWGFLRTSYKDVSMKQLLIMLGQFHKRGNQSLSSK